MTNRFCWKYLEPSIEETRQEGPNDPVVRIIAVESLRTAAHGHILLIERWCGSLNSEFSALDRSGTDLPRYVNTA